MRATQPARFLISACLTLLFFAWTVPLNASITMTGTRIIYNGSVKSTDVHLKNKDAIPYVVQTWFDNGNMADGPEKSVQVPFIATPPHFVFNRAKDRLFALSTRRPNHCLRTARRWSGSTLCRFPLRTSASEKPVRRARTVCLSCYETG